MSTSTCHQCAAESSGAARELRVAVNRAHDVYPPATARLLQLTFESAESAVLTQSPGWRELADTALAVAREMNR